MSVLSAKSNFEPRQLIRLTLINRGLVTTIILLFAMLGFELFNYSTTFVALNDLLGDLSFLSLKWATILAIAFCAIDFAGITRLFMPEDDRNVTRDTWFLFGAWLLAASMNAILTWWGISMSIASHPLQSSTIVNPTTLTTVVPVFVAMMVWVTRILLIGSFSFSGQRLLNSPASTGLTATARSRPSPRFVTSTRQAQNLGYAPQPVNANGNANQAKRPATLTPRPRTVSTAPARPAATRPEPEYVPDPSFQSLSPRQERPVKPVRRF